MTKLSVNINKIATLRNARGGNIPDVVKAAVDIETFGADGITVHPRPDQRHIRYDDLLPLRTVVKTEFNIEGYPSREFLDLVISVKPEQVTLVPDPPGVLTSNAGWNVEENFNFLKEVVSELKSHGFRVSLFMDAVKGNMQKAAETNSDRIELYTESYATNYKVNREKAIDPFIKAAESATSAGLGINAGHDLNLENLKFFADTIPGLLEVSIGHALISDALYMGLEKTVKAYKMLLNG